MASLYLCPVVCVEQKFMRIFVRLSLEAEGIVTMIGPVVVRRDDSIGAAEAAIRVRHATTAQQCNSTTGEIEQGGGSRRI